MSRYQNKSTQDKISIERVMSYIPPEDIQKLLMMGNMWNYRSETVKSLSSSQCDNNQGHIPHLL